MSHQLRLACKYNSQLLWTRWISYGHVRFQIVGEKWPSYGNVKPIIMKLRFARRFRCLCTQRQSWPLSMSLSGNSRKRKTNFKYVSCLKCDYVSGVHFWRKSPSCNLKREPFVNDTTFCHMIIILAETILTRAKRLKPNDSSADTFYTVFFLFIQANGFGSLF